MAMTMAVVWCGGAGQPSRTTEPDSRIAEQTEEKRATTLLRVSWRASTRLPKTTPLPSTPLSFRRHSSNPFKIDQSQPRSGESSSLDGGVVPLRMCNVRLRECMSEIGRILLPYDLSGILVSLRPRFQNLLPLTHCIMFQL